MSIPIVTVTSTGVRLVRRWQVRRHVVDRFGGSVSWAVDRDYNGHDGAPLARRLGSEAKGPC